MSPAPFLVCPVAELVVLADVATGGRHPVVQSKAYAFAFALQCFLDKCHPGECLELRKAETASGTSAATETGGDCE